MTSTNYHSNKCEAAENIENHKLYNERASDKLRSMISIAHNQVQEWQRLSLEYDQLKEQVSKLITSKNEAFEKLNEYREACLLLAVIDGLK